MPIQYKPKWIEIAINVCAFWSMFTFVTIIFMIGGWVLLIDWIGLKTNLILKLSITIIDIILAGYFSYLFMVCINKYLSNKSFMYSYFFLTGLGIVDFGLMLAPIWVVLALYTSVY